MAPQFVLGYWHARGIANPIRYLLEYAKADYTEEHLSMQDKEAWTKKKASDPEVMQLSFPNLPYLIEKKEDGSVFRLTQSAAIMRYLGKKFDLVGRTPEEDAQIDMLYCQIYDIRDYMRRYNMDDAMLQSRYPDFKEASVGLFEPFSKILGDNQFLGGDRVTYVDFYFYEILQTQKLLNDAVFTKYPNLEAYIKRFEELPQMAEYFKSDRFVKSPFFGPFAKKFGYP